jgi:hypothetical protein
VRFSQRIADTDSISGIAAAAAAMFLTFCNYLAAAAAAKFFLLLLYRRREVTARLRRGKAEISLKSLPIRLLRYIKTE